MKPFAVILLLFAWPSAAADLGKGRTGDILYVHHAPDPVNVRNGNFYLPAQDYYFSCFGFPLEVYRSYNSVSTRNGPFGRGWTFNYDIQIAVGGEKGMTIVEADGFVNEYAPLENDAETKAEFAGKLVEVLKKEDVKYTGKAGGKGEAFYKDFRKKLLSDKEFYRKQLERYLPEEAKTSRSGKYISRRRGVTYVEKTAGGYLRTTETGRKEEYNAKGQLIRLTDRNGNRMSLDYNTESRLDRVADGCGHSLRIAYNGTGKIVKITDSLLREMAYVYDNDDRLLSAVSLEGEKTAFTYDAKHRMTSIVFSDGAKTEIAYDPKTGYVVKQSGPGTKVTNYQYGKEGAAVWAQVTDNEGEKSKYEYNDADNRIIFTDRAGKKTITTVSSCCGKPLSIKDERGAGDEFKYDEKGNLISKTSGKQVTTFTYEPRFNLPSEIKSSDGSFVRFLYDAAGNLSFSKSSSGEYVKLTYESHGKIRTMTDHNENIIRFEYSAFGKPTRIEKSVKDKKFGSIAITYDKTGEIQRVDYDPKSPEAVQNIKDTLASFLRLLKPSGIDFEI